MLKVSVVQRQLSNPQSKRNRPPWAAFSRPEPEFLLAACVPVISSTVPKRHGRITHQPGDVPYGLRDRQGLHPNGHRRHASLECLGILEDVPRGPPVVGLGLRELVSLLIIGAWARALMASQAAPLPFLLGDSAFQKHLLDAALGNGRHLTRSVRGTMQNGGGHD